MFLFGMKFISTEFKIIQISANENQGICSRLSQMQQ
jgi:hypothetical protein